MSEAGGEGRPAEGRIDAAWYDSTDYFDGGTDHLTDMRSRFQRYRVRMVTRLAEPGPSDVVADFGCGWGTFEFALADRVAHVTGIDFSERSIELCRERLARDPRPNVDFRRLDAGDTGYPEGSFDLVIAADLYEHVYPEDSARITREAFRILKPGGRFAVWTPHRGHLLEILKNNSILLKPDPAHVDYKSMDRMRSLLGEAGFEIARAYYAESHLPGFNVVERLLQPVLPWFRRRIALLGRKPA